MILAQAGVLLHKVTAQYSLLGFCGTAVLLCTRACEEDQINPLVINCLQLGLEADSVHCSAAVHGLTENSLRPPVPITLAIWGVPGVPISLALWGPP